MKPITFLLLLQVPYRLLVFELVTNVQVCLLCGSSPSLMKLESEIGRFWKPAFESLKSLSQIYPRNFPLSTVIDQNNFFCILYIFLILFHSPFFLSGFFLLYFILLLTFFKIYFHSFFILIFVFSFIFIFSFSLDFFLFIISSHFFFHSCFILFLFIQVFFTHSKFIISDLSLYFFLFSLVLFLCSFLPKFIFFFFSLFLYSFSSPPTRCC
ncbi:FUZ [Acanthosepion pharaonis]|uniref:FUZ n=1 Tax=Acanthosepion pharaonis TaxID=158019 RepID=A0A812E4Q8_ACAPH|nr:FUZ [Sepia pharaonis]